MGFVFKDGKPVSPTSKGTEIMDGLMLNQYQNSPNLRKYLLAYMEEFDTLFEQISEVYNGRFLEGAVGVWLDHIGEILQQPRNIALPVVYFGFQGAIDVDGFSSEAAPARGGVWLSEESQGYQETPLDDTIYRRVLHAKAFLLNKDSADINLTYRIIAILLDRIPRVFSITSLGHRRVQLTIDRDDTTQQEVALILYMSNYFVPAGITFTINQV